MPASAGVARCQLSPGSGQDLAANAGATPVPRAQAVATAAVAMIRLERTASSRRAGYPSGLEQPPLHRPRRQLVTAGELELSKHGGHVGLYRLGRDLQPQRDLLVPVAGGD